MAIWWRLRGRAWIAVKRSRGKGGRLPHFGIFSEGGDLEWHAHPGGGSWTASPNGSALYLIEYAPDRSRRKQSITQTGDFPLLFSGLYYIRRYRLEAEGIGATFDLAAHDLLRNFGARPVR